MSDFGSANGTIFNDLQMHRKPLSEIRCLYVWTITRARLPAYAHAHRSYHLRTMSILYRDVVTSIFGTARQSGGRWFFIPVHPEQIWFIPARDLYSISNDMYFQFIFLYDMTAACRVGASIRSTVLPFTAPAAARYSVAWRGGACVEQMIQENSLSCPTVFFDRTVDRSARCGACTAAFCARRWCVA